MQSRASSKISTVTRAVTGGIASVTDPTGREIYSQTFDAAGRLLSVSSEYFEDHPVSIAIAYDGFGRKQSVTHGTGLTGTYAYDILNRVTSIAWSGSDGSSTQAMTQGLAYNTAGNITSQQREHGLFTYNYDNIDQLTAVAFSGPAALDAAIVNRTWTYDRVGNRIGDTLNGAGSFQHNILTENDKYEYVPSVDGSGALGERINKLTGEVESFSYRADGRLKAYENNTQKVEYVLDPLGRIIAKKVTNKSDNTTFNQSFLHLGSEDRVLFAKDGSGKQYLYLDGQGIDEHLAEVSATHYKAYATDHLGSVLNTSTAGSNNVYGPWGETIGVSAQQILTPTTVPVVYGWQGLQHDAESGDLYNRARTYSATTGIFPQPDPAGFSTGETNLYRSRKNNALIYVDNDGQDAEIVQDGIHTGVVVDNPEMPGKKITIDLIPDPTSKATVLDIVSGNTVPGKIYISEGAMAGSVVKTKKQSSSADRKIINHARGQQILFELGIRKYNLYGFPGDNNTQCTSFAIETVFGK